MSAQTQSNDYRPRQYYYSAAAEIITV